MFEGPDPLKEVSLLEVRRGQFVKDWHEALAVEGGFLELRNLPAGDYSLYLKPEARDIAVAVTQGEDRDGFILSARRALERPRLAPLQIAAVEPGAEAVEIRLANVHAFHARPRVRNPLPAGLRRVRQAGLHRRARAPGPDLAAIPDVLRIRAATSATSTATSSTASRPGSSPATCSSAPACCSTRGRCATPKPRRRRLPAARAMRGAAAADAAAGTPPPPPSAGEAAEAARRLCSLDFLKQPAVVLLNLAPDKEGRIRIPRGDLKGKPQLRILAVDPLTTVLKDVALEDTPVETRELRLAGGLDPAKSYSEQKLVTPVPPKARLAIADATTARFEICDTVAKAYRLLATLGGNPTFEEFSFVANWPDLDPRRSSANTPSTPATN